ncbi:uncharacterized protein KQ657_002900 [Scheffersomyces spartinae]|uniref:F-box domain-containing protein n=1 Tax=Scheffersomyces spartinae TaxID=45513 RepID=A0A9P7V5A2_9ASCO|nr:uncharacterized protein KQ657_002900 [Scheffersomyces spartinae]KAG7191631.1 hypothetical protein KQ657_002900 [Scheffersomyces spartinae]
MAAEPLRAVDFHSHLPPYRSLLNPSNYYDYKLHTFIKVFSSKFIAGLNASVTSKHSTGNIVVVRKKLNHLPLIQLPEEILTFIFSFLDVENLLKLLTLHLKIYRAIKPLIYKSMHFTLSYKLAQFITVLRIDSSIGPLVESVDLSCLESHLTWRDYKRVSAFSQTSQAYDYSRTQFAANHNRSYRMQQLQKLRNRQRRSNLSLANSNVQKKFAKEKSSLSHRFIFWRRKKSRVAALEESSFEESGESGQVTISHTNDARTQNHNTGNRYSNGTLNSPSITTTTTIDYAGRRQSFGHVNGALSPINFSPTESIATLLYSLASETSPKDVPIGYLLHLLNLCPNMKSLNLAKVSISQDYKLVNFERYHQWDLLYVNYPNLPQQLNRFIPTRVSNSKAIDKSTPIRKYHSLISSKYYDYSTYRTMGDSTVYLSDLTIRSLEDSANLSKVLPSALLSNMLQNWKCRLNYINLSQMIWPTKDLVRKFIIGLIERLGKDNLKDYTIVLDLTESGMLKNLMWAKEIRLFESELAQKIIDDDLYTEEEIMQMREREGRATIGQNYLSWVS